MYSFLLTLTKTDAKLELLREGNVVAEKVWQESRDMGRQLFEAIQGLLQAHGLKPTDITDFRLETEVSDNFTSVKIAQTVQRTFLFAVRERKTGEKEAKVLAP